jgi:2-polyprenyl-3-methyl-5-hydroxy-6-metoxy-1,4-benzoquinol methylase
MQIPNFNTDEGALLYANTIGQLISPRVADEVMHLLDETITNDVQTILDAGCGPGTVSLYLASKYPNRQVHGIDASAAMIAQCEEKAESQGLKNATFDHMKVDDLDFGDRKFDLVVCNLAFPFFSNPVHNMQKVFEVLRPGGIVCFSVIGKDTWKEFFEVAEETLGEMVRMARPFLLKFAKAEKLPSSMELAGFNHLTLHNKYIPFEFANGSDVLSFFSNLFSLLSFAPVEMREELTHAIDKVYSNGFKMHYHALIAVAKKPE